ncbi:MAG: hypothetical protein ACTH1T_04825 [Brachybacterium tyrofermentans]
MSDPYSLFVPGADLLDPGLDIALHGFQGSFRVSGPGKDRMNSILRFGHALRNVQTQIVWPLRTFGLFSGELEARVVHGALLDLL